ncbi:MAG: ClbS/DfsB family four-helix bundle protein [Prevotellaceae bacterium]|jgi:hypothetical protein|nr:ClbS/DfsB family four-helix bundle protein [Prevotellaceae bacterium]
MKEYTSKQELIDEIKSASSGFVKEFVNVREDDKDLRMDGVDRTPQEMIAYQLGWMNLIRGWDSDEQAGKPIAMPAPGIKWNQMGELYSSFYKHYSQYSLMELCEMFTTEVDSLTKWLDGFSEDEVFKSGGRKWASSTSSNWPIWKWVHINTVAPFSTFKSKIRKWKKLHAV